ncbi:MAG TPA: hypothetical protein VGI70_03045 [Polyangiales bacterium]
MSHASPNAIGARHTRSLLQTSPLLQSLLALHGCSASASVWHVPHAASAARAQRVLAHSASLPHACPFERPPLARRQVSGNAFSNNAWQPTAAKAVVHALTPAALLRLSGA